VMYLHILKLIIITDIYCAKLYAKQPINPFHSPKRWMALLLFFTSEKHTEFRQLCFGSLNW
jgi:hypothetical protein